MFFFIYRNFSYFNNYLYGNCYTFNSGLTDPLISSSKSGPLYGKCSVLFCIFYKNEYMQDYYTPNTYKYSLLSKRGRSLTFHTGRPPKCSLILQVPSTVSCMMLRTLCTFGTSTSDLYNSAIILSSIIMLCCLHFIISWRGLSSVGSSSNFNSGTDPG